MAKKMIAEVDGNSTKNEELETLMKIVALAKPGSYLHSFFTPAVSSDLHWAIVNDWNCNLVGDLQASLNTYKTHSELATRRIAALEQQVSNLERDYARSNDIIEDLQNTLNNIRQLINHR